MKLFFKHVVINLTTITKTSRLTVFVIQFLDVIEHNVIKDHQPVAPTVCCISLVEGSSLANITGFLVIS